MTGTITYDAVADIKTALTCDWDAGANCAGAVPRIREVWNVKVVGFGSENDEEIIIDPKAEEIKPFDMFGKAHWHTLPIELDIRVYSTVTRLDVIVKEVERIVKNIIRRTAGSPGFLQVIIEASKTKVPESRNKFRHIIYLRYDAARSFTFV